MISNVSIETKDTTKPQGGGGCGCGCSNGDVPRLVARDLPKKIRNGAIMGALMSLQPGDQMELVAPHAPHPLLRQIEQVAPGAFAVETVADDPQAYVVRVTRN